MALVYYLDKLLVEEPEASLTCLLIFSHYFGYLLPVRCSNLLEVGHVNCPFTNQLSAEVRTDLYWDQVFVSGTREKALVKYLLHADRS